MSTPAPLTLASLGDIEVTVSVSVGCARCSVSDVLAFAEGTVVPLGVGADSPVDLMVNGVVVAVGDIVELEDGMLAIEVRSVHAGAEGGTT
ncbi:MAG TPA: FliM/FliN family flagellar motor switch protein [Candidatus Eremiobacteraceae bacterium]|nr:FliM/FliN family flagellar motor switch protein [Candidatus Eremiobacteraceae bacterium]